MEARRKSNNCTKVSQKLKELMMNKGPVRPSDRANESIAYHSRTPIKSSASKSSISLKPQVKVVIPSTGATLVHKDSTPENKENIYRYRNLSIHEKHQSREPARSRDKTTSAKTQVSRYHKKVSSMCEQPSNLSELVN
jgi:hypothetical protein